VGAALALIPNLPVIPVLLGVQVVNGLLLPIELFAILKLINNPELMGQYVNGKVYNFAAWSIAIVISLLSLSLIILTVLEWCGLKPGS
ncbi:MAG TPA: divalent metal cation transporter, partial [Accumulibacter sp.]|nr:divalent metal cation transporter [Accumulibacter sp.]